MSQGWCPRCQKTRFVRVQSEVVKDKAGKQRVAMTSYCGDCGTMLSAEYRGKSKSKKGPLDGADRDH